MLAQAPSKMFFEGNGFGIAIPHPSRGLGRLCCGRKDNWKASSSVDGRFRRVPMETPGAYQLLDETTGERVIVWGGSDDDPHHSPIPSDHVLSWKTPKEKESGVGAAVPAAEAGSKPTARVGGALPSFGKLKYHRVKALIKKSSQNTKEHGEHSRFSGVGDPPFNDTNDRNSSEGSELSRAKGNDVLMEKEVLGTNYLRNASKSLPAADVDVSASVRRNTSSARGWGAAATAVKDSTSALLKQPRTRSADGDFFSRKSFKDVGCSDDMIESLRSQTFIRPSHIQALAYGPVLEGRSCVIADQSGSGKTLAYLAPVIQRLREEEVLGLGRSSSRSPRVIILVPTAELASQVLINCRRIAKFGVPFRSMVATGGFRQKTQLDILEEGLDVLIATPGRFLYLLQEGFVQLTNLKCVVLDEVDILFGDDGFEQILQSFISSAPVSIQYLFVTATLPVDIYNKLVELFPDCKVTMGPGVHRTSSSLEEVLVDCSGDDGEEKTPEMAFLNKKTALLQLLEESPVPKTIIFCNKIQTCRKVENVLNRFDRKQSHIKVLPFHAALDHAIRHSNMKEFLNSQSKHSMILICTDRASRGIDFMKVDHVVLFDFPRDPSEYVRRVGRTARGAGGRGKAYVFVVGKQVSLARRIIERNKKGHPLHDVPCAYELERSVL